MKTLKLIMALLLVLILVAILCLTVGVAGGIFVDKKFLRKK